MRRLVGGVALGLALVVAAPALAQSTDPAAAREQLKTGYELKKQGKCAEAVPHLQESVRLDPKLKALANLADCEEQIGHLVDAEQHWVLVRDQARREGEGEIRADAERRLAALEKRMPKLAVKVASDAPAGTQVARDGVVLGAVSLGAELPTDPGAHTLVARAPGFEDRSYGVTLAPGESKTIVVGPGAAKPPAAAGLVGAAPGHELAGKADSTGDVAPGPATPGSGDADRGKTQRIVGYVAGGVGLVGLGLGSYFGLHALGQNSDSNANGHCDASGCDAIGKASRNGALDSATLSTITFAAGGVLAATGVVLVLTAPRGRASTAVVGAGPMVGMANGLQVSGRW